MLNELHITRATAILKSFTQDKLCVLAEDGHKYHISSYSSQEEVQLRIASNLLSQSILNSWKLNYTYLAGIHLHPDLIKRYRPVFNEKDIYSGFRSEEGQVWMTRLLDDGHYWSFKAFENADHLLKIGLLDLWILNHSRTKAHPGLILSPSRNGKLKVIPLSYHQLLNQLVELKWDRKKSLADVRSILEYELVKKSFYHLNKNLVKKDWYEYFQDSITNTREHYTDIVERINNTVKVDKTLWNQVYIFLFDNDRNERVFNHFWNKMKR